MKNVLITGAAGFIGSNLFAKCIEPEQDWNVTGVDDLSNGHVNFIDDMSYTSNGPKDHSLIIDDFASKSILRNIKNRKYDLSKLYVQYWVDKIEKTKHSFLGEYAKKSVVSK